MPRVILYPRRDGGFYRHICKKPGPQAQPELRRRKRNLTLGLGHKTLCHP